MVKRSCQAIVGSLEAMFLSVPPDSPMIGGLEFQRLSDGKLMVGLKELT